MGRRKVGRAGNKFGSEVVRCMSGQQTPGVENTMTNETNHHSIRRLILEAIISGTAEAGVSYILDHAATIATGCTWIVHHLLG